MLVFSPAATKAAVGVASNLYLAFNQAVVVGTGNITVSNGAGDTRTIAVGDATQVTISGKQVTINPTADLIAGTTYSVTYAAGVFKDSLGNNAPAIAGTDTLSFKAAGVVDTSAPLLVGSTPADNATGITSSRVTLTFNEQVVAGSGSIVIASATDTRTIPVGDITQVTFSGNSVAINPNADLKKGVSYQRHPGQRRHQGRGGQPVCRHHQHHGAEFRHRAGRGGARRPAQAADHRGELQRARWRRFLRALQLRHRHGGPDGLEVG